MRLEHAGHGRLMLRWLLAAVVLLILGGCRPGEPGIAPPEIQYGVESCAQCNMIISDARFAAGYVIEVAEGRYESLAFDDIGDMLEHAAQDPAQEIVTWYVHDYATEEWLDATDAHFVVGQAIRSPMAAGLAAHAHVEQAHEMAAAHDGMVLDWSELQSALDPDGRIGMLEHQH